MPGEGFEGRVPAGLPLHGAGHDRAHAVVQDLGGASAEVLEGVLVGGEQRPHALVLVALGPGAARVAQRHHEHVHFDRAADEARTHLAPVDLGLVARLGLEASLRERGRRGLGAQRAHGDLHRVVAAAVAAARAQFLEQDPCRVMHLRRALSEPTHVRREQRCVFRPNVISHFGGT